MTLHPAKGFTLIETVIVSALFLVITLALGSLFISFYKTYGYQNAIVSAAGASGRIIDRAQSVVLPADQVASSHVFSGTTYTSSATTLVVEMPSIDSSGVTISGTYDYAVIYRSGTTVYLKVEPAAASSRPAITEDIAEGVSSLSFAYDNADFTQVTSVTVDTTAAATSKGDTVQSRKKETIYLRN
jgi:prepilin-type N-terminal cleavage/methylation domain-containing protein